jgi:hypothetical protein
MNTIRGINKCSNVQQVTNITSDNDVRVDDPPTESQQ